MTAEEIAEFLEWKAFAELHKSAEQLGMHIEKSSNGELVIHTGWTFDDDTESYRPMTEDEVTGGEPKVNSSGWRPDRFVVTDDGLYLDGIPARDIGKSGDSR